MKRLLLILAALLLAGCATYYSDPYYSDRYYERRHSDRYYYDHPRDWVYSSWYYDLYDPYSALFHPIGYLYDPWYYDYYRFGVHRYPSRFWNFSFYGGRPWFYSPWYGGYGLYHPYGHYSAAPRRSRGVPTYVVGNSAGETAQHAARGLAADLYASGMPGNSVVSSSAVRVSRSASTGPGLLGSMATEDTRINGLRQGSRPGERGFRSDATGSWPALGESSGAGVPGTSSDRTPGRNLDDRGLPFEQAGFNAAGSSGLPSPSPLPSSDARSEQLYPAPMRTLSGAEHPWRDARPLGNNHVMPARPGPSHSIDRSPFGSDAGMRPGLNSSSGSRSEPRSYSAPAPRTQTESSASRRDNFDRGSGRDHD